MLNATNKDKLEFVKDVIVDMLNDTYNATGIQAGDIAYNIIDIYHEEWKYLKTLQRLTKLDSGVGFRIEPAIIRLAKQYLNDFQIDMTNATWYRADADVHDVTWYMERGDIHDSMAERIARVGA